MPFERAYECWMGKECDQDPKHWKGHLFWISCAVSCIQPKAAEDLQFTYLLDSVNGVALILLVDSSLALWLEYQRQVGVFGTICLLFSYKFVVDIGTRIYLHMTTDPTSSTPHSSTPQSYAIHLEKSQALLLIRNHTHIKRYAALSNASQTKLRAIKLKTVSYFEVPIFRNTCKK